MEFGFGFYLEEVEVLVLMGLNLLDELVPGKQ